MEPILRQPCALQTHSDTIDPKLRDRTRAQGRVYCRPAPIQCARARFRVAGDQTSPHKTKYLRRLWPTDFWVSNRTGVLVAKETAGRGSTAQLRPHRGVRGDGMLPPGWTTCRAFATLKCSNSRQRRGKR